MKKSFWFWLCFFVAIVLAVYFATRIVMTLAGRGPASYIRSISISTDSGRQNLSAIATAAAIAPGTKTFSTGMSDVNERIMARVPDVKKSAVRRLPNGNLSIRVELHRAVALWTDGENFYPLSADGTIVNRPMDARPDNTILFSGKLPNDLTEIVKAAHNLNNNIEYLEWIEDRRWNIHMAGGLVVMLPEEDPYAAVNALMIMDKNHKILSKNITVLDMRDVSRILVKQ